MATKTQDNAEGPKPSERSNQPEDAKAAEPVKALVLVDCAHGKCGEVVEVSAAEAEAGQGSILDATPAAVAAAQAKG